MCLSAMAAPGASASSMIRLLLRRPFPPRLFKARNKLGRGEQAARDTRRERKHDMLAIAVGSLTNGFRPFVSRRIAFSIVRISRDVAMSARKTSALWACSSMVRADGS